MCVSVNGGDPFVTSNEFDDTRLTWSELVYANKKLVKGKREPFRRLPLVVSISYYIETS